MSFVLNGGPAIGQPYAPLRIKTAGRDVVVAGTAITADNKNLEFNLAHLRILLSFETDGETARFGSVTADGTTLTLPLYNFDNSLGSGTTLPIEIGTLHNRKLYLAFMIYALTPASSKVVHYTFMVGDSA